MFCKFCLPLAAMLAALTLAAPAEVPASAAIAPEDYLIRNVRTGRYLTAANHDVEIGALVIACDADGISDSNRWIMEEQDGAVRFTNENNRSGMALGIDNMGRLTIVQRNDADIYQLFTLEENGGSVRLSAGGWALTPEGDGNCVPVTMQVASDTSDWELIPVYHNPNRPGDLNKDGVVDIYDLGLSKRLLLSEERSIEQMAIANVDDTRGFSLSDVVCLSKYLLGAGSLQRALTFPTNTLPADYEYTITPTETLPPTEPETEPPTEPPTEAETEPETEPVTDPVQPPATTLTLADMPANYKEPMEWIWTNRMVREGSTSRRNTIIDQIMAGQGTLNFVVRWQSYRTVTYEQRQQFEKLASDSVNAWTDYLRGYDGWPYDHVEVKVVGWAVLDKSCLLDLHDDEIVYDNLIEPYDATYDTSNGVDMIPDKLPSAPAELSRFDHFAEPGYQYPGGLDKRFDMYLWCTQGFPNIGGCGGDWGQRLSDTAYLNMLDGSGIHVLTHEIGHGFGITDFYGGEGQPDGFPPGGFPGNGTSLMMAGSSAEITDFDSWMLRYIWSQIKDEAGRF